MYNYADFYLLLVYPDGDYYRNETPTLYLLKARTEEQARLKAGRNFKNLDLIDMVPITLREWEPVKIGEVHLDK